ncbi:MAG: hypothetical protein NTW20_02785 [Rhodobacterales bacterium]|nr:hypothetical protein [Rhodobacterales bacterium]
MRSVDLARIVAPHLGGRLVPSVITMPGRKLPILQRLWARTRPRGGIYFMTKTACQVDSEAAALLKARSIGLCYDYVDHDLGRIASDLADEHVCASYAQQDRILAMQQAGQFAKGPTQVVLHNADAALYGFRPEDRPSFSAVYCGNLRNTFVPERLARDVVMIDASKPYKMKRNRQRLSGFALHYCIRDDRPVSENVVKPFTKGVTAAVCRANLVTSRDVPDAVRLLGEDYPFLADGNAEGQIVDAFLRARDAFGGPDWRRGLAAMDRLRERVSGPALAVQMRRMAELLGVF